MSNKYKLAVDKDGFTIYDAMSMAVLAYRRPFESAKFRKTSDMLNNADNAEMHERLKELVRRANQEG